MKILILRLSSLGDIVLTEPVTAELRRSFPSAQIHYLTKAAFKPIAECFESVDKVICYGKNVAFHLSLLKERYDIVLDLHAKLSTMIVGMMVPHKQLLRYRKEHGRRRNIILEHIKTNGTSTVELYLKALSGIEGYQAPESYPKPKLVIPQMNQIPKMEHAKPLIAVFPGATHQTKMLPVGKLKELIGRLGNEFNFIILGTREEHYLGELLSGDGVDCQNLCGHYNLPELVRVLSQVDLVVTNDSGPMHLAAALEKPQIACFGATHPSLGFSPLNSNAKVMSLDLDCQPCSLHGGDSCPLGHFACMNTISVESLEQAVRSLL